MNLQSPLRRFAAFVKAFSFTTTFWILVVSPDMSWTWKETDEFEALIAHGFFSAEQEASIRDEAARMVRTIESVGRPFCDGWPE